MQRPEGFLVAANGSRGCWLAARCVDQSLQLRRDRHGSQSSDTGAPRVAMGKPAERRLHGGSRDPEDLSHGRADVTLAYGPPQHEEVNPRVQPGRGLTQHVRALEICKGRGCIAPLFCAASGVELGLDGEANAVMETGHDYSCEMG